MSKTLLISASAAVKSEQAVKLCCPELLLTARLSALAYDAVRLSQEVLVQGSLQAQPPQQHGLRQPGT